MNNGKVLIVERDRFYRELYSDLLTGIGYEISINDSYDIAPSNLEDFDLIIYEPNKHEESFTVLASILKAQPYKPEIMIITSGDVQKYKAMFNQSDQQYTYIKKPFDDNKLINLVTNAISKRRLYIDKDKLAREGMEYFILLEVYKRASEILSQKSIEDVLKKLTSAMVIELKAYKAMIWLRDDGDNFNIVQSFGYETEPYDESTSFNWKGFKYKVAFNEGYYIIKKDSKSVMYVLIQSNDGHIYAMLRLVKEGLEGFSIQDVRIMRTLATFGSIAMANAIELSSKIPDTLRAGDLPAYTYKYFIEYTENEIRRAHRMHGMFSLSVVSIENYRELVETFGKNHVNAIFKKIANLMNEVLRDADTLSLSEHSNMLNLFLPDTDYFGSIITIRRIKNQLKQNLYITDGLITKNVEIVIGAATYPVDGTTVQTLLSKAYESANKTKSGILKQVSAIEYTSFAEFADKIIDSFSCMDKDGKTINAVFTLTKDRGQEIIDLISYDMIERPYMRGMLFVGLPFITKQMTILIEQYKLHNSSTKFYIMGKKTVGEDIDISYAPVMIMDEDFGNRYFIFNLNEEYAYGFVAVEQPDNTLKALHTSEPLLVEEFIAVLQEKYFLQRQI